VSREQQCGGWATGNSCAGQIKTAKLKTSEAGRLWAKRRANALQAELFALQAELSQEKIKTAKLKTSESSSACSILRMESVAVMC
jgi:hypothetical protein